tara:strand:+ start:94 stop:255 length:162 start_codon:yes stop_codon:yes gene_type:complete
MKILIIIFATLFVAYTLLSNNSSRTVKDNYGQYDKGTALCDKGAFGEVNGLCK